MLILLTYIELLEHYILKTELRDVPQHANSMPVSWILYLTDLLPGVVLVVPQDLPRIIISVPSSCKYIAIINSLFTRQLLFQLVN